MWAGFLLLNNFWKVLGLAYVEEWLILLSSGPLVKITSNMWVTLFVSCRFKLLPIVFTNSSSVIELKGNTLSRHFIQKYFLSVYE